MPKNVEIKAKIADESEFERVKNKAKSLSYSKSILEQKDTFFKTLKGRLKLRECPDKEAELIYYDRPNATGPKLSDYTKTSVPNASEMKTILQQVMGIKGTVKKKRFLYFVGQTRVHLDVVEGLGHFLELEVQLKDDQSVEEGEVIANDLMGQLGVEKDNLLAGAYMDLLEKK